MIFIKARLFTFNKLMDVTKIKYQILENYLTLRKRMF
jgi:hypothetical protein